MIYCVNWHDSTLVINLSLKKGFDDNQLYNLATVYNSNVMKLRHSTICTLYSSTKFEALIRTKCIRRNMRSTCQWSCVLQFTWRRAVCCGLHRPMSQVIPCLGLNLYNFFTIVNSWYRHMNKATFVALSIGIVSYLGEGL